MYFVKHSLLGLQALYLCKVKSKVMAKKYKQTIIKKEP